MIGYEKLYDNTYEVAYCWRDLPDRVKAGEEDHIDYAEARVAEELGPGEWVERIRLVDSVWVGVYRVYTAPAIPETPITEWIHALADEDPCVREAAIYALGDLRNRRAVPALINTLRNDNDPNVRVIAAYILGELGDPSAIQPVKEALLNAIRQKDWGMWVAAEWALDELTRTTT